MTEKRLNYFDTQFLRALDFDAEQEYHIDRRRRHNKHLHTSGIADGLNVTHVEGTFDVSVGEGAAIDVQGREIVVVTPRSYTFTAAQGPTAYLTIEYFEQDSDVTDELGISGETRTHELAVIAASATPPGELDNALLLAEVTLDASGVVVTSHGSRRLAGVKSGDLEVTSLTFTSEAIGSEQWPSFRLGETDQSDVVADLDGSLRISGDLIIEGEVRSSGSVGEADLAENSVTREKIADNAVGTDELVDDAVTLDKILNNAVTREKIADNAVGTEELLDDAVTSYKILNNAVTREKIADNAVGTDELVDDAVTSDKILNDSVTSQKIEDADGTSAQLTSQGSGIKTDHIQNNAITSQKIEKADGTSGQRMNEGSGIKTGHIQDLAISNSKLSRYSVTGEKIDGAQIEHYHLVYQAVTTEKIDDEAVTTGKINDGAVTTDKIKDLSVDKFKIADDSVFGRKIQEEGVSSRAIRNDAVISIKIAEADGTSAQLTNEGEGIKTGHIQDGAITSEKIANNSVGANEIVNGSVGTLELANDSVTSSKISINAVGAYEIINGSVGALELADNSVTASKIVNGSVGSSEIRSAAVGTSELANNAVTGQKIAVGQIKAEHLSRSLSGSITISRRASAIVYVGTTGRENFFAVHDIVSSPFISGILVRTENIYISRVSDDERYKVIRRVRIYNDSDYTVQVFFSF